MIPTQCVVLHWEHLKTQTPGINPRKFPRLWQQYVQLNSSPQRHQMVHLHVPVSWRIYSTCMIGHSLSDESSYCHYQLHLIPGLSSSMKRFSNAAQSLRVQCSLQLLFITLTVLSCSTNATAAVSPKTVHVKCASLWLCCYVAPLL